MGSTNHGGRLLTVVQKMIIDSLHMEGETQKVFAKEAAVRRVKRSPFKNLGRFTKSGLQLESVLQEPPHTDVSMRYNSRIPRVEQILNQRQRQRTGYSYKVAVALSLFLGWLGADRFYLGYPALGLLKFCTVGFCGIGSLVDFILISMQNVRPDMFTTLVESPHLRNFKIYFLRVLATDLLFNQRRK
ncbi:TM2 domain-containing protein 1 precursor [Silurus meridionalis]|nr:TM2 domain-containing protein 1 precursor [Silurus meridionalis]